LTTSLYVPSIPLTYGGVGNNSLTRNESQVIADPDGQKNLEGLIDTIALSTFRFTLGDGSNDNLDGSYNETRGIASASSLFAGSNINWQERIRSWFETDILH
jgi:hypothetical protein